MLEDLIGPVALVGLIAIGIWLNARLTRVEREHRALLTFVLSNPGPASAAPQPFPADAPVVPAQAAPIEPVASVSEPSLLDDTAPPAFAPPQPEPQPEAAPQPRPSVPHVGRPAQKPEGVETALGTKWAVWVGGVALAFGGLFLVKYTIESGFFGPGVRLLLAGIFGLILIGTGEFIRRSGFKVPVPDAATAFVPAILTAAGSFTLFATIYSAHAIYGFIGPGTAFGLLGIVGVLTMGLALVHGQLLGGLGLLGSLVTPILVSSQSPNPWALFGYLAMVLITTVGVARLRRWVFLSTAAFAGTCFWALVYLASGTFIDLAVVLFISAVLLGTLAVLWLGDYLGDAWPADPKVDLPSIFVAILLGILTLALFNDTELQAAGGIYRAAVIVIAMLGVAIWRSAALPLVFGAGFAILLTYLYPPLSGTFSVEFAGETMTIDGLPSQAPAITLKTLGWLFAALYLAAGAWKARALVTVQRRRSALWAVWAAAMPVIVVGALWLSFGNLERDYLYAAAMLAVVALLAAASEWIARAEQPALTGGPAVSILLIGAGVGAVTFFHMAFGSLLTTIFIGAAAALPALATRVRRYSVLGWLSLGAVIAVMIRAGIDPTIVGSFNLGRTPVFNALLPGYGIPALAFAFCAWQLARTTDGKPRLAMEASAVLFAMLTVAMLVRHAMNGGVITSFDYTLSEQAIYTLLSIGAGAILISLDMRSPSPVMRYGSIGFGILSAAMTVLLHFLTLNPLFTDESTGQIPFFNLLFLAYLLPAIAAGGLAFYARGKRPYWYSAMLGLLGAVLSFAYATLSVRRWFQGEFIGLWRGMTQLETYTYSAVWLIIGVGVLVIGVTARSQVLRIASAVLIAATVAKVFLFDMSELEGVLRALSFIGLGAVLIGIGLFYQRLLTKTAAADRATPVADAPPAAPQ